MNVLVTGWNGFVGKNLYRSLVDKNIRTVIWQRGNFSDTEKYDVVINCAAELYDESKMIESNIVLVKHLLEKIKYDKFIQIGSSSEYGYTAEPITEKTPLNPKTMYEITKCTASQICEDHARKTGKSVVVVRPFSLYGPNDREKKLIPTLTRNISEGKPVEVYQGMHDWVYIDDFVDVLIKISKETSLFYKVINIGTGFQRSNYFVYCMICDLLKKEQNMNVYREKFINSYDRKSWVCNPSCAKLIYEIECKTSLEEGLKKYVEWYRTSRGIET